MSDSELADLSIRELLERSSFGTPQARGLRALTDPADVAKTMERLGYRWITCPRCGATSYNRDDIREGYCGACHDWTGPAVDR